jgi:protein SCO1/2
MTKLIRRDVLAAAAALTFAALSCAALQPAHAGESGATPAVDHSAHTGHAMPEAAAMPGDSLYQLPVHFTTAGGDHLMLQQYSGQPVVVTMFYGTCKAACPMLTRAMTETAASLPASVRDKVRFLMVTLDPERDTPAALQHLADEYKLEAPRFEVARTDANGVRLLAASLGIRYRKLPDGNFSHSSILTALDVRGVPRARTETLLTADPEFVGAVAALAK